MEFYNLPQEQGIEIFNQPHNIEKIKSDNTSLNQYNQWLQSFKYIHNDSITVALRPNRESIEYHFVTHPNVSIKNKIKSLQSLSELLNCPLVTYINSNEEKLMDFCCKRFGFVKGRMDGSFIKDDVRYSRFQFTRPLTNQGDSNV